MKDSLRSLLLPLCIVIASAIIGISMIFSAKIIAGSINGGNTNTSAKMISSLLKTLKEKDSSRLKDDAENIGSKKVEGVTAGTNPIKGNIKAPVLMVEFSDFQCPFSKRFYQQAFPQIEKEYIDTGKVKFAYRDFPIGSHPFAKPASIAAKCAGRQGKYWQMFDKLTMGSFSDKEIFKKYAQESGLDLNAYEACLDKPELSQEIEDDVKAAEKIGVQGTPTFFINGRFVSGARPFVVFKKIIEEELAKPAKEK